MKVLIVLALLPVAFCQFGHLVGGRTDVDVNRQDVQKAATFAMTMLNAQDNGARNLDRVVSAQTQVVAGVNYFLNVEIHNGNSVELCRLTVYEQAWLHKMELTDHQCAPQVLVSRQLGGIDITGVDSEMQKAISFAVEQYNAMSNNFYRIVPKTVMSPSKQVVAGVMYRFTLNMVESSCRKSQQNKLKMLDECPALQGGLHTTCSFEILFQAWMTPQYKVHSQTCHNLDQQQHKQDIPPGFDDVVNNVKDVLGKYKKNPQELLGQFIANAGELLGHSGLKQNFLEEVSSAKSEQQSKIGGDDHDLCHGGRFKEFQMQYGRVYGSEEERERRFIIFCDNMKTARKLNRTEQGTAWYGATKFADLTEEEFKQYVSKRNWNTIKNYGKDIMKQAVIPTGKIPKSFDWRDHDAVTPVKNQGSCGSCWAFSTTGNIEGQWAIHKKQLLSLSEQELVDCDKVDQGCEGGLPSNAYKAIIKLGGLETEKDYSYRGRDEKCFFNHSEAVVDIQGAVNISSSETEMAAWLARNGPISIGINAFAMQFYMGGISHPWKIFCNPKHLDHGVLIVGYGVEGSEPYWIIKNSWGESWGEKGYYLVYRGGGVCGLNTMCTSATV